MRRVLVFGRIVALCLVANGCSFFLPQRPPRCDKTGPVVDTIAAAGSGALGVVFSLATIDAKCDEREQGSNCFATTSERTAVVAIAATAAVVSAASAVYGWRDRGRCIDERPKYEARQQAIRADEEARQQAVREHEQGVRAEMERERQARNEQARQAWAAYNQRKHDCLVTAYDTTADAKARAECGAFLEEDRQRTERERIDAEFGQRELDRQQQAAIEGARIEQAERERRSAVEQANRERAAAAWREVGKSFQTKPKTTIVCKPNGFGGQTCTEQ